MNERCSLGGMRLLVSPDLDYRWDIAPDEAPPVKKKVSLPLLERRDDPHARYGTRPIGLAKNAHATRAVAAVRPR